MNTPYRFHIGLAKYESGEGFSACCQLLNSDSQSIADASLYMSKDSSFVSFARTLFADSVDADTRRKFVTDCEQYMKTASPVEFRF